MVRAEIEELVRLGEFPASDKVDLSIIKRQHELLERLSSPATQDEARLLIQLFGSDDYFGAAWTVLHLVESAPGWPIWDLLPLNTDNEWVRRLRQRAERGQRQKNP